MLRRTLRTPLLRLARKYPIVSVTGPRQSGKTTLVQSAFPRYKYVSLEDPDQREFATEDPRGFLARNRSRVVLDEVQRVPTLFSYLQTAVDRDSHPGRYILSGSQSFLLLERVSQTLAGRVAILNLLPFSLSELEERSPISLSSFGMALPRGGRKTGRDLFETLLLGFYPRIHDQKLPVRWYADYYRTYVERDVREISNVGDIEAFGRFVRLCAGRNGQLLNLLSMANDCGITHTTARRWLSTLEASFIVTLLRPHHRNFGRRVIRSPKIYFLDTGLLCFLLRIRSAEELQIHSSRGAVFESYVVSELLKNSLHRGEESDVYFWRDSAGHEIDILIDRGSKLTPVEVKSAQTVSRGFFAGLDYWRRLAADAAGGAALVYGGTEAVRRSGAIVYPWSVF